MKKVEKPSKELRSLVSDQENVENLQEWIKLLTAPFGNEKFADNCFRISSVFHKGTEIFLPYVENDLIRIDFPTTVSGVYVKTDTDYDDEGCIILSIENHARISFSTANHSVPKHKEMYKGLIGKNAFEGTWEMVAQKYFEYLKELMAVPAISQK